MLEERIRDLIEEYQNQIEILHEDLRVQKSSLLLPYETGKVGVYGKVVKDLQGLLEDEDA